MTTAAARPTGLRKIISSFVVLRCHRSSTKLMGAYYKSIGADGIMQVKCLQFSNQLHSFNKNYRPSSHSYYRKCTLSCMLFLSLLPMTVSDYSFCDQRVRLVTARAFLCFHFHLIDAISSTYIYST